MKEGSTLYFYSIVILYIIKYSKPDMLADDTQITTSNSDISVILENLNADLLNVSTWMSANKLTLNNNKTEFMVIGSKAAGKFATAVQKYCWRLNTKCN